MAHLFTASNPRLYGPGSSVVNLSPSACGLPAPRPTEPKQTQSSEHRWVRTSQHQTLRCRPERSRPPFSSPHPTPVAEPTVTHDMEAPSHLAASHQTLRPQLSQAFRRLYGTAQHKGILTGLTILKLYCECLGTTWAGNPDRDPVVFFRTADMADTSRWQHLPAEFDKTQAKAYSFTQPNNSANLASDRSSGLDELSHVDSQLSAT